MTTEIDAEGLEATPWPPVKKALWDVLMAEKVNDGHYIKAFEFIEKLYAAYLSASRSTSEAEPVADAGDDDFVSAAEGIGLYCGDEPNDEVVDADPMEAALDAFLGEHPLPYVEGKSPRVALAAAIRAYLAPARTVITGIEQATLPTPASDDQVEAVWPGENYALYEEVHNAAIARYEASTPADYRYSATALRHAVDEGVKRALAAMGSTKP